MMESILWVGLWMYVIFQLGTIRKGNLKNGVMVALMGGVMLVAYGFGVPVIGLLLVMLLGVLFDLFYDEEPFFKQWPWLVGYGIGMLVVVGIQGVATSIPIHMATLVCIWGTYILLGFYRKLLHTSLMIVVTGIYSLYGSLLIGSDAKSGLAIGLGLLTFGALELVFKKYHTTYERKTSHFQQELLLSQYEEIKHVYLNMRGFRHDYHNHIQVMKAHLQMQQLEELEGYLQQLEGELQRIDNRIRSGNMMLDAILNSKVTLAEQMGIAVNCKAEVPDTLPMSDIDLCIVLGNLLDNAIEACEKIEEGRFLRIYITTFKNQLYLSIQNAAKEALDFNERSYISTKRGNHGLGMKRVKVIIDKYEGYVNLQNESGVFAAEVTLPL